MNGKSSQEEVVGRAELKLKEAVKAFRYDFAGKDVLDIGSSTGGFTELAIKNGARKVVAVEIGTNQMKAPLRFDPRVELHEKTDFLLVNKTAESASEQGQKAGELVQPVQVGIDLSDINTVVADVSFISLKKILAHAQAILPRKVDYLVMLKPQFEARPFQLNKGVVKNEKMRREIIKDYEMWLKGHGFLIVQKRDNELTGKNGNRERFYWLKNIK